MGNTPDRLPLLSAGCHLSPDDGACFMELVPVLAGQCWSEQPNCTDPTLSTVAGAVNDAVSDTARQQLIHHAPDLVRRRVEPGLLAPAIVAACLDAIQPMLPRDRGDLRRHRRRAARHLARRPTPGQWAPVARLSGLVYRRGPAQHAIAAAIRAVQVLPTAERDLALHAMLTAAIRITPTAAAIGRTRTAGAGRERMERQR
jgi:hypothetical protein